MKADLLAELNDSRLAFHALLDSLSEEDLHSESRNPPWTNQQILFHMAFGFFLLPGLLVIALVFSRLPRRASKGFATLLNRAVGPFNVINALGPQGGGRLFTRQGLRQAFDLVYGMSVPLLQRLSEEELQRGMHYPTRWDPLFGDYMTVSDIVRFAMKHFYFHVNHIARG